MIPLKTIQTFDIRQVHVGGMAYGADILETLEAYCEAHDIQSAWVNLLGALSQATLAYYRQDTHTYVTRAFSGEFEILGGIGNMSHRDGHAIGHLHLTLSGTDFGCIGGHLMKGSSRIFACEFVLYELTGSSPLVRGEPDAQTGLPLWRCPIPASPDGG